MANKFGSFLRVAGAALSPQAFQAQTQEFQAEQAQERQLEQQTAIDLRQTEDTNLKIVMGDISAKMAFLQKLGVNDPRAGKIVEGMKRSAASVPERYRAAVMSSVGDELALITGLSGNKGKARTVIFNNKRMAAVENPQGQLVDPVSGEFLEGAVIAPTRAEQGGAGAFTKKTKSDIEKQRLSGELALDRLSAIKEGFQSKFTEIGTRASVKLTAFAEKIGLPTSKSSRKELQDFTTFARNTLGNINQHIRDRTGAVMNKDEIPRLMAEMPSLGTGLLDTDSSTQFMAKLDGVIKSLEAAEARLAFVQANGLGSDPESFGATVSLQDFRGLPSMPKEFDSGKWNKMTPRKRHRLIELMKSAK